LLAHAKAGGEASRPVFEYLQSLGDAGAQPPASLTAAEAALLAGTYKFGIAANQQIDVTFDGQITWTRSGTMGRPLFHLGDQAFYPLGDPAVRIHFHKKDGVTKMTVKDPDLILTAQKAPAPK